MQNEALFRDKPVWKAILIMALPAVFNVLITILYNMTDMFFIGQLGSSAKVGAISVVSPVFSFLSAVSTMFGAGGCAAISKTLGSGETGHARSLAALCQWALLLLGAVLGAGILLFCTPLLSLLGATADMQQDAAAYLRILAVGTPFMLFSQGTGMLMRSEGAIKEGFIIGLVGTGINMALDPVFILAFQMGTAGAALATAAGNMVSSMILLWYVLRRSSVLNLLPHCAMQCMPEIFMIMALGLPNALSSLLSGLAGTFSNRLLGVYGTDAIAAMGAAGKINMVISLVQMGICMGVQPLMAYAYGARNLPRLKEVLFKTGILTVAVGTVTTVGCSLARHNLIGMFLKEEVAAAMGEQIVVYRLLAGPLLGLFYISTNFLQSAGNAALATVVSVLRQGLLLIPLLYLMSALLGLTGLAMAHTVSDIAAACIGVLVCLWQYRTLRKEMTVHEVQ